MRLNYHGTNMWLALTSSGVGGACLASCWSGRRDLEWRLSSSFQRSIL